MARKRKLPEGISVISLRLPQDLHDRLRVVAEANHRTISQEVRRAVDLAVMEAERDMAA